MRSSDVKVGGVYRAKVSGKFVDVRIDAVGERSGGWGATNLITGKPVRIRSGRRLMHEVFIENNPSEPKQSKSKIKPAAKPTAEPAAKRLGANDAAAQVLAEAAEPLSAKQMIERMTAQKLWNSPGGKTPEATLYAAIVREIAAKGRAARFVKIDRGRFIAHS